MSFSGSSRQAKKATSYQFNPQVSTDSASDEPPAVRALATVAEANNASAEDGTANGIIQLASNTTPKTTTRQTPRGGRGGMEGVGRQRLL